MNYLKKINKNRSAIIEIAKKHKAKNIRLFGSVARGDDSESSDIDFLLSMESNADLLDIVAIKQDLEELLGVSVDVVTENSVSPYIKNEVLKEAVNL